MTSAPFPQQFPERPDKFMPIFIGETLAEVGSFSTTEIGALLLLKIQYWRSGKPLPNDDLRLTRIARMSPAEWSASAEAIKSLFVVEPVTDPETGTVTGSVLRHIALDRQLDHANERYQRRKAASDAANAAKKAKSSTSVVKPVTDPETETVTGQVTQPQPQPQSQSSNEEKSSLRSLDAGAHGDDQVKSVGATVIADRYPKDFERFIDIYPQTGEGPHQTFVAWKACAGVRPPIAELVAAVTANVSALARENKSRPATDQRRPCHASKWLAEARWKLYRPSPPPRIGTSTERKHIWGGHPAAAQLCAAVGDAEFEQWFAPCVLVVKDNIPHLKAPSRLIRDRLANKHMDRIERAFDGLVLLVLEEVAA